MCIRDRVYMAGIWGYFKQCIFGILVIVAASCLVGFMFILRKALRFLNPKEVVPERVRSAFNALAEGVLILDNKENIMMANDAFARQVDRDPGSLLGVKASSLKWKLRKSDGEDQLPWIKTIKDGVKMTGIAVNLSTPRMGVRAMSANSAPILDDEGKTRGSLVTFDDITDVEESNVLLENAVTTLQKNDAEIRRKNVELEVLASRDALTGCYNRRAFFDLLEDMFIQAVKTNTDLVAIMVDIDHFKSINDRFGHGVGDEAIRLVTDILNACEYEGAVVGRYGGEEFCMALPNADLDKGHEVAEALRKNIKQSSEGFLAENTTITASFGVSNAEASMSGVTELLEHADKALYIAKESGRNRVVAWIEGHEQATDQQFNAAERVVKERQLAQEAQLNESQADVKMLNRKIQQLESALKAKDLEYAKNRSNDPVTDLPTRIILSLIHISEPTRLQ